MTKRQANRTAVLIGLSPLFYIVPGMQAKALGGAAWLGCLAALPPLAGLGMLLGRRTPRTPGRLVSALIAPVLAAAAIALLHGCAVRYYTAVGVFRSPLPYAALLLITAVPAALSRKKALARASEVLLPLVLTLLAVTLACAAKQVRPARLIDLTAVSVTGVAQAALPILAVGAAALILPRLFTQAQPDAGAGTALGATAALVCMATVGALGGPMAARLEFPVFTLTRNLSLLHTVERLDGLMAAVWLLPDVTALALLLRACGDCALRALGRASE